MYNTNKVLKHKWTINQVKLSFNVVLSLLVILLYAIKISFNELSKLNIIGDTLAVTSV